MSQAPSGTKIPSQAASIPPIQPRTVPVTMPSRPGAQDTTLASSKGPPSGAFGSSLVAPSLSKAAVASSNPFAEWTFNTPTTSTGAGKTASSASSLFANTATLQKGGFSGSGAIPPSSRPTKSLFGETFAGHTKDSPPIHTPPGSLFPLPEPTSSSTSGISTTGGLFGAPSKPPS